MACDIDDREGESPLLMKPGLGRMFHSSATGRRRERSLPEALDLRQALHPRDDLRAVPSGGADDRVVVFPVITENSGRERIYDGYNVGSLIE
jgi:hypothetical protein